MTNLFSVKLASRDNALTDSDAYSIRLLNNFVLMEESVTLHLFCSDNFIDELYFCNYNQVNSEIDCWSHQLDENINKLSYLFAMAIKNNDIECYIENLMELLQSSVPNITPQDVLSIYQLIQRNIPDAPSTDPLDYLFKVADSDAFINYNEMRQLPADEIEIESIIPAQSPLQ